MHEKTVWQQRFDRDIKAGTCSNRCPPDCTTDLQWEVENIILIQSNKKFKDFNLQISTHLAYRLQQFHCHIWFASVVNVRGARGLSPPPLLRFDRPLQLLTKKCYFMHKMYQIPHPIDASVSWAPHAWPGHFNHLFACIVWDYFTYCKKMLES